MKTEHYFYSLSDVFHILKKNRFWILLWGGAVAVILVFLTIKNPPLYVAEASYRAFGSQMSPEGNSITKMLLGSSKTSECMQAITTIESKCVLDEVGKKLHMEAVISENRKDRTLFSNMWDNILAEVGYWRKKDLVPITSLSCPLQAIDINYSGLTNSLFTLNFTSENHYIIKNQFGVVGEGELGSPFRTDYFTFTIQKKQPLSISGKIFNLTLRPLSKVTKELHQSLHIDVDEEDDTLLILEYRHPERKVAQTILQNILLTYQDLLKKEHDRYASIQLSYLTKRQKEMFDKQTDEMKKHARMLSNDLSSSGFVNFDKEMEFLFQNRLKCLEKIQVYNLQKKRLQSLLPLQKDLEDMTLTFEELLPVSDTIKQLSHLKMKREALRLAQKKVHNERSNNKSDEFSKFLGIDMETVSDLYLNYLKEGNLIESTLREYAYLQRQIHEPDFEINSLSTTLKDPISQEIIKKSSTLALILRDDVNHSLKEKERTKQELATQKQFLEAHLAQTTKVLEIQQELLQETIKTLQSVMLDLANEKILLLEKHISDFISSEIDSIEQKRTIIEHQMNQINQTMASLPEKWISEELIKQNASLNKSMVEELTKLVESTNIRHNLNLTQSSTLDAAFVPSMPKSPKILLFAFLGGILGSLLSSCYFLGRSLLVGVDATFENLNLLEQKVAGHLEIQDWKSSNYPLSDQNLETLRNLRAYLMNSIEPSSSQTLLIVSNGGPDISEELSKLFFFSGKKPLLISLCFDEPCKKEAYPGLHAYLQGKAKSPKITQTKFFDCIDTGGISRYGLEHLCSDPFSKLLTEMRLKYHWVILVVNESPLNASCKSLVTRFDCSALILKDEKVHELNDLFTIGEEKPIVFLLDN